nr:hypothetical protein [Acidobacteriota bacterium]
VQHSILTGADAAAFWRGYQQSETDERWAFSFRLSALPADLDAVIKDINKLMPRACWGAHAANGIVRIHGEEDLFEGLQTKRHPKFIAELRQAAQARGGQLVVLQAPQKIKDQLDTWGDVGQTATLMRELKRRFDPQAQLSPGRFVGGI